MQNKDAKSLLQKYTEGADPEDKAILDSWYLQWKKDEEIGLTEEDYEQAEQAMWRKLQPQKPNRRLKLWLRMAAAAAVVLMVTAVYFFFSTQRGKGRAELVSAGLNIGQGKSRAMITLANGRTIDLSESKTGIVISKAKLTYDDGTDIGSSGRNGLDKISEGPQMITTPKGGTYHIVLSDGTRVWLNAASSLTYSTGYNKLGVRSVTLSGEAYFEVAKDKRHPFIVKSRGQDIEVLGTHFNVNSYADESSVKTTLLEGSVKVMPSGVPGETDKDVILKPGQQSSLSNGAVKVTEADLSQAVAWKNGEFMFNDEQLEVIMRKIARWYNVDIVYQDKNISKKIFGGTISKFGNVSDVLSMLELTGDVHFKINGRRIIVTK